MSLEIAEFWTIHSSSSDTDSGGYDNGETTASTVNKEPGCIDTNTDTDNFYIIPQKDQNSYVRDSAFKPVPDCTYTNTDTENVYIIPQEAEISSVRASAFEPVHETVYVNFNE